MSKTVAIVGAGNVAKYFVEELRRDGKHNIIVISRAPREWFVNAGVELRISDYSTASILEHIQDAEVLVSLIHDNSSFYNEVHIAMLEACKLSKKCKQFIPSEMGGDIEKFPDHPGFYVPTHGAIRKVLEQQNEIEYTLFNIGWFMDYFVPADRTYMGSLPVIFPLDLKENTLRIAGTGDEPLSFTSARDVAKALVKLVDTKTPWEKYIYTSGETTTWHKVATLYEKIKGVKLAITYKSEEEVQKDINTHKDDSDPKLLWLGFMDMWNATGAAGVPTEKVHLHREKYFKGVHFRDITEFIKAAEGTTGAV